ncbi:MAG: uridine phosphorylase, partial [Synergistaceae bacterium]|nr:uridine phosphorylase [Synergistaceae bacterium]
ATVFTVASVYGLRAGAVFAVVANRVNDQFVYTGIDHSVKAANEALKILAERDELKRAHNKKFWYSSLGA